MRCVRTRGTVQYLLHHQDKAFPYEAKGEVNSVCKVNPIDAGFESEFESSSWKESSVTPLR